MTAWKVFLFVILMSIAGPHVLHAQTAKDRAGELKLWRDRCNEPDTDLRMAYIEEAITTDDTAAKRICTRLALSSKDADLRNVGLRAAIASMDQITFDVEYPAFLAKAYKKAGSNADKRRKVDNYYIANDFPHIQNGVVFSIQDAKMTSSKSTWFSMTQFVDENNAYKGQATIRGDKVSWSGKVYLSGGVHCTLNTKLFPGNLLKGKLQCGNRGAYKVSVKLL